MHNYADTFEVPVVEEIDGKQVTIPLLSQRDYLPWIAEITNERKRIGRETAPKGGKALDLAQWNESIENLEVTPAGLQPYIFRASGTLKVLELALKKAGVAPDVAEKWIDARGAKQNEMLAVKLSGLFRIEEINAIYPSANGKVKKEDTDPNAEAPEAQQSNGQTGRSGVPSLKPEREPTFST